MLVSDEVLIASPRGFSDSYCKEAKSETNFGFLGPQMRVRSSGVDFMSGESGAKGEKGYL